MEDCVFEVGFRFGENCPLGEPLPGSRIGDFCPRSTEIGNREGVLPTAVLVILTTRVRFPAFAKTEIPHWGTKPGRGLLPWDNFPLFGNRGGGFSLGTKIPRLVLGGGGGDSWDVWVCGSFPLAAACHSSAAAVLLLLLLHCCCCCCCCSAACYCSALVNV